MFWLKFFFFWLFNIFLYLSIFIFFPFHRNKFSTIERIIITFIFSLIIILIVSIPLYYLHLYKFKFIFGLILLCIMSFLFYNLRLGKNFWESYIEIKDLYKKFFYEIKNDFLLLIIFLFTFLTFSFLFIFTLICHPHGTDVYTYHIPVAARIIIEKGFPSTEFLNLNPHQFYFPKNMEILYAFYYTFLGTDRGILTLHFPFLFFGILASYLILRKLNVSRNKALYVFSFLQMPIIPALSQTLKPDLEVSFIFLIFLSLLLIDFPYNLFFSLITLSFGCGIKYSLLIVFFIFFTFCCFKFIKHNRYWLILGSILLCILTSFHFYIFNFILKKNPLFPFEIKFFNISIFKGKEEILKSYFNLPVYTFNPFIILSHLFEFAPDVNYFYTYDNLGGGFGHYFISLGFISFFILFFIILKNKDKKILMLLLFTFLFFFTSPFRWWPRFHIYLCCISIIFSIYIWERLKDLNFNFFITFITIISFFESHHDTITAFSPFFRLFDYKENAFNLLHTPSEILKTYSLISLNLRKEDKIAVWDKDWPVPPYPNLYRTFIGIILAKEWKIRYDAVYDFENLKFYEKIIAPSFLEFQDYEKLYSDENLSFWVKKR